MPVEVAAYVKNLFTDPTGVGFFPVVYSTKKNEYINCIKIKNCISTSYGILADL